MTIPKPVDVFATYSNASKSSLTVWRRVDMTYLLYHIYPVLSTYFAKL